MMRSASTLLNIIVPSVNLQILNTGRCASRPVTAEEMTSEEIPPTRLDEDPPATENEEEAKDDGRLPRGSWEGSYITQADIDRLR